MSNFEEHPEQRVIEIEDPDGDLRTIELFIIWEDHFDPDYGADADGNRGVPQHDWQIKRHELVFGKATLEEIKRELEKLEGPRDI
jgi:hypothetical protein